MAVVYWKRNRTLAVGEFEGYAHENQYYKMAFLKSSCFCLLTLNISSSVAM